MVSLCASGEEYAGVTQYSCSRGLPEENDPTPGSVYVHASVASALFHLGMGSGLTLDCSTDVFLTSLLCGVY